MSSDVAARGETLLSSAEAAEVRVAAGAVPATVPRSWRGYYARAIAVIDIGLLLAAVALAQWIRFGVRDPGRLGGLSYPLLGAALAGGWWLALLLNRCYESRFLGAGPEEYRRVAAASFRLAAVVAMVSFALHLELARGFVAIAFPAGMALLLAGRYGARRLFWQGSRGLWAERMVVAGDREHVVDLVRSLHRDPHSSVQVVGACLPGRAEVLEVDGRKIPVVGSLTTIPEALRTVRADAVAVTASGGITPMAMRQLGWSLEGSDVDLVVAPALVNVAGPRISLRPVAGLPLMHVEQPEFRGVRRAVKESLDRGLALVALVLLSPALVAVGLLVRLTSRGPALFRQVRVGRDGQTFGLYKFRSMCVHAEEQLATLREHNEGAGLLFKLREDPRITPLGRLLRRFSIDELPQLLNVVRGQMALVGPRPPLPEEVARYDAPVRRRLLVKPGITGLWQVSGRSSLGWDDYVRLDLQYVENWSITLDLLIMVKTVAAVLRRSGAY